MDEIKNGQEIPAENLKRAGIPPEMFERPLVEDELTTRIIRQKRVKFIDKQQHYPDKEPFGTYREYFGCRAYEKGVIEPRIAMANDNVKHMTVALLKPYFSKYMILPAVGLLLTPWKWKIKFLQHWLEQYNRNADQHLCYVFLKPERYCACCQELRKLIGQFLTYLGINADTADYTAKVLANLVEFDVQYKYPIQDFFSSTNKELLLKKPFRELRRLLKLSLKRDKDPWRNAKAMLGFKLLSLAVLHPRVRKAWKKAWAETDIGKLQLDEDDFYFCITRFDYNYGGLTEERRREIWMEIHNGQPPLLIEFS